MGNDILFFSYRDLLFRCFKPPTTFMPVACLHAPRGLWPGSEQLLASRRGFLWRPMTVWALLVLPSDKLIFEFISSGSKRCGG